MLKLHNLSKIYRTDDVETLALNQINIEIAEGEFVAIMGPSGCGKSTLLNTIGMLDSPSDGHYIFNGEDISGLGENQLADIRKRNVGFIFQNFNLIDELTVQENIELALLYHDIPAKERQKRVASVMDKVGIAHRAKHMPSQLSGGQQQRVAVARAVVGNQKVILADEPTAELDLARGEAIVALLKRIAVDENVGVVVVTHDLAMAQIADVTRDLSDGAFVA